MMMIPSDTPIPIPLLQLLLQQLLLHSHDLVKLVSCPWGGWVRGACGWQWGGPEQTMPYRVPDIASESTTTSMFMTSGWCILLYGSLCWMILLFNYIRPLSEGEVWYNHTIPFGCLYGWFCLLLPVSSTLVHFSYIFILRPRLITQHKVLISLQASFPLSH